LTVPFICAEVDVIKLAADVTTVGAVTTAGVWKNSTVVKPDSPAALPAATFHRYVLPPANVVVKLVVDG
jgi:hypothetical protein